MRDCEREPRHDHAGQACFSSGKPCPFSLPILNPRIRTNISGCPTAVVALDLLEGMNRSEKILSAATGLSCEEEIPAACRRLRSNSFGKYIRVRAARPKGHARCGDGAGCSAKEIPASPYGRPAPSSTHTVGYNPFIKANLHHTTNFRVLCGANVANKWSRAPQKQGERNPRAPPCKGVPRG